MANGDHHHDSYGAAANPAHATHGDSVPGDDRAHQGPEELLELRLDQLVSNGPAAVSAGW
jgi:hypothetical protein